MRLLKDEGQGNLSIVEKHDRDVPPYAILSHTWGADGEEVTFKDLLEGTGRNKAGYEKIDFCRKQAASDGLQHFWVDTCCIDKSSSAELSEAINSMFRWYLNASRCYVYLSDVLTSGHAVDGQSLPVMLESAFRESRWFTRGWTLQELIAPASVEFFSQEGDRLGSKSSLEQHIHEITGVAIEALRGAPLTNFDVDERFSWADLRQTKRQEDKVYSLLGIFNIHMSLRYGEGSDEALMRLQRKIYKSSQPSMEQPKSRPKPKPSSTVPFRRDAEFVDCRISYCGGTLLEQIEQQYAAPAARVALVGIGGSGKSQIAIEYCYRLRARSPNTWVFWIHASNVDRIEQGYREIAERVNIPDSKNPKVDIFELVASWLRDEEKGAWFLVLDNLDDDNILAAPQATPSKVQSTDGDVQLRRPLSAYLPQSQHGAILVTTRIQSIATKLVEPKAVVAVEPMINADAIALLKKKVDERADDSDLGELTHILEYMPLAIVQAAAYIYQKGARYSVRQYIEAFQRNEKQKISLLNYDADYLRRDPEAKNSIIITWQISFDDIRKKWPPAADLLSLMCFFDRQGIPKDVLKVQSKEDISKLMSQKGDGTRDDEEDIEDGDYEFEEAVERLRGYSFVSIGEDRRTFEMHGLVQLATRKWLEMHGEYGRWNAQFCVKLNTVFPTGKHENWSLCEMLFPHAKSAERQRPMDDKSVREWAQILRKAAWYALEKGDYREAARICKKSVEALSEILGEGDMETLYSLVLLSATYWRQGQWTEAEKIEVTVIETSKRVLGEEHPDTLTSMANLASTYYEQGRWVEAEKIEVTVMEISKRVLGEEHPDTLTSMANLASTYYKQGQRIKAEKIGVHVMETRKRVLGEEHPNTLNSIANLASIYHEQGRWVEAEKIEVTVMEIRKRVLGEEHPNTLNSIANLASIYHEQGRWVEAEKIGVQVMEIRKRVLGEEHPNTLTSIANLASTYHEQGQWIEAEKIGVHVIETRKRVLGEEHPDTLTSMANLASTYYEQGRWVEAEKIEVTVMETRKRVLGEEHPDTLMSMNNLAFSIKGQGRQLEAINLMVECVQLQNRVLGAQHPGNLSSAAALAVWQNAQSL